MIPTSRKTPHNAINIFANVSMFRSPYEMPAPITKLRPTDMTKEINPTALLSAAISSSILNRGVKNS